MVSEKTIRLLCEIMSEETDIKRVEIVYNDGEIEVHDQKEFIAIGFHEGCFAIKHIDKTHQFIPLGTIKKLFLSTQ